MTICHSGVFRSSRSFDGKSRLHYRNFLLSELQCDFWRLGDTERVSQLLNLLIARRGGPLWDELGPFRSLAWDSRHSTLISRWCYNFMLQFQKLHCRHIFSLCMYSRVSSPRVWCYCIRWGIRFHTFYPTPNGCFLVAFRIWLSTIPWISGHSKAVYFLFFHNIFFLKSSLKPIQINEAHFVQRTGWRTHYKPLFISYHISLVLM